MRFIQTFLPALREAPGQGARIVCIRARHSPTDNTVCTDLIYLPTYQPNNLPTYQPTYPTRVKHSQAAGLFISRLQAHASKLQLYAPGARIVQISSIVGLFTAPGVGVYLRVGKVATAHT